MKRFTTLIFMAFMGTTLWGQTQVPQNSSSPIYYKDGKVGIDKANPQAALHVKSGLIDETSTSQYGANFIIEGNDNVREIGKGAALGFVVPANSSGSNTWQQGRILVTPDNSYENNANGRMYLQTRFLKNNSWHWRKNLVLLSSGRVGINKDDPSCALDVAGTIRATEIKVEAKGNTADFVFDDSYPLRTLDEVEAFIKKNQCLPDIPNAASMEKNGVNLAEMNKLLLQKIEELTLYAIEQEGKLKEKDRVVEELKAEGNRQKEEVENLKEQLQKQHEDFGEIAARMADLEKKIGQ
jgi:hypothetical protein